MASMRVGVLLVIALSPATASAQSWEVKITEPCAYQISDLFKAADVVAMVKILSAIPRTTITLFTKAKLLRASRVCQAERLSTSAPSSEKD